MPIYRAEVSSGNAWSNTFQVRLHVTEASEAPQKLPLMSRQPEGLIWVDFCPTSNDQWCSLLQFNVGPGSASCCRSPNPRSRHSNGWFAQTADVHAEHVGRTKRPIKDGRSALCVQLIINAFFRVNRES